MPGPRPDESARLRETTPGGYRIRPYGKSLPPPTVANRELYRYGRRPRRPVGRPPYASPAKRSSLPGLSQPCRGRACPARGLTKAPVCGKLPRADIESAPTGNRCRPLQWRTAGVHTANPSFNNNRRPSWKTSPAGGGLLCVNRVYLLILSITANSSGVNVVCSTALMLSRICCVLEAPIRTVVTSSWCSSQARAISARV